MADKKVVMVELTDPINIDETTNLLLNMMGGLLPENLTEE